MRTVYYPGLIVLFLLFSVPAEAGSMPLPGGDFGLVNVPVKSIKERRFTLTVHQKLDFSCGSAALSTLLTHHYGDQVSEANIFKSMWDNGDHAMIRREGFSLLDLKRFLETRGYSADGYKTSLDKLAAEGIPAIVLIRDAGYRHFVVIKGLKDGYVAFGDPSRGARVMPQKEFEKMLINRLVFVINGRNDQAVFNSAKDWRIREKAPLSMATSPDSLANTMLFRRPSGDY